jgi:hypothetical protein
MRCCLVDSLTWVYPDSDTGTPPCLRITHDVARGATAAAALLLKDVTPGATVRFAIIPRLEAKAQFFRLCDVPVECNTGPTGFMEKEGERNESATSGRKGPPTGATCLHASQGRKRWKTMEYQ